MNSRIQKLPQDLAEKIAAGEVVERPFSVVKELVENSLDAGAGRIDLFIEEGGKKLIRIQDDGIGMNPNELKLALERHATSKISSLEDLWNISTLGFRGEAIPSIAAISRFSFQSSSQENKQGIGYEIQVEGGKILACREKAHPQGTTVEVRDLFFNTPARLKFLKSNETEWGHIQDYVTAMALAYPEVQFVVHHQNKEKIRYLKRGMNARLLDVFGADLAEGFYAISEERQGILLKGFVGHPSLSRSQATQMYFFLNGRLIKDRLIQHAVLKGYRNFLMQDQYPTAVLFLQMPPQAVDVNVHPAKREVRFVQPQVIHEFIVQALSSKMASAPWAKSSTSPISLEKNRMPENFTNFPSSSSSSSSYVPQQNFSSENEAWFNQTYLNLKTTNHFTQVGKLPFGLLKVLGQLKKTYIVCESEEHLVLIDQHAAHERIGFEKFREAYASQNVPTQALLVPFHFELEEREKELLLPELPQLEKMGLVIEEFGPKNFLVKALPSLLGEIDVQALIRDILDDFKVHGNSTRLEERADELFATMACHRQIRAGDSLSIQEMETLLKDLGEDARNYHCPHGRPVMVQILFREVEKWFKRVL